MPPLRDLWHPIGNRKNVSLPGLESERAVILLSWRPTWHWASTASTMELIPGGNEVEKGENGFRNGWQLDLRRALAPQLCLRWRRLLSSRETSIRSRQLSTFLGRFWQSVGQPLGIVLDRCGLVCYNISGTTVDQVGDRGVLVKSLTGLSRRYPGLSHHR